MLSADAAAAAVLVTGNRIKCHEVKCLMWVCAWESVTVMTVRHDSTHCATCTVRRVQMLRLGMLAPTTAISRPTADHCVT